METKERKLTIQMEPKQAITYELKEDPARPGTESKICVGTKDCTYGMVRLDDWLMNGEPVFLRFDYTDHLHITHFCGAEMRMRKTPKCNQLELKCSVCHSKYEPYRHIGPIDEDKSARPVPDPVPIRFRNDTHTFVPLMRLCGYDRVIRPVHPVAIIEDDRFEASSPMLGNVQIKFDRHRVMSFVHASCGREMQVKITQVTDYYNKDFLFLRCRCNRFKTFQWIRKVVTELPENRDEQITRNTFNPTPTGPVDWLDAVTELGWTPGTTPSIDTMENYVVRALLKGEKFPKPQVDYNQLVWYHPSRSWDKAVVCIIREDCYEIHPRVTEDREPRVFTFDERKEAVEWIRKYLRSV